MTGLEMKYFILKPRTKPQRPGDPYAHASRRAMRTYANEIEDENPGLAKALHAWINAEIIAAGDIATNAPPKEEE